MNILKNYYADLKELWYINSSSPAEENTIEFLPEND